jgi:hypothetical protein
MHATRSYIMAKKHATVGQRTHVTTARLTPPRELIVVSAQPIGRARAPRRRADVLNPNPDTRRRPRKYVAGHGARARKNAGVIRGLGRGRCEQKKKNDR